MTLLTHINLPKSSVEIPEDGSFVRLSSSSFWSSSAHFGQRASFSWDSQPASLDIRNIYKTEAGVYRCRVDFKESQTRNLFVNLTVVVPPDPVLIYDEDGNERMTFVGPYLEGEDARLTCRAFGGYPVPRVEWLRKGAVIDSTFKVSPDQREVSNQIILHRLSRDYLHSELTCSVSNTNLTRPIQHSLHIDMNFAPADVSIRPSSADMLVGKVYEISCSSSGSRPPPVVTWYLDNIRLEGSLETFSSDGNSTESSLSLNPTLQYNTRTLSCHVSNPAIPHSTIKAETVLNILYPPNVELNLGRSISSSAIYEGGDVYFDCKIGSNPAPTYVSWFLNDVEIKQNVERGVIFTNQSLVLQKISRNQSGNYLCEATNPVGKGRSQPIFLDVKYVPVCKTDKPKIYGVSKRELVNVLCQVESNPPEVEFKWTFNNSAEMIKVPVGRSQDNRSSSVLSYTPLTTMDFGTIMCTAMNMVGTQKNPCVFHIIMAVSPDPVENCTVIKKSSESFHLRCNPGFDGGLNQTFAVQVEDRLTRVVAHEDDGLLNPVVKVQNLLPGAAYLVTLTSVNKKGRSEPRHILVETLQQPEIQEVEEKRDGGAKRISWEIYAGIGTGIYVCVVFVLIVVFYLKRRRNPNPSQRDETNQGSKDATVTEEPSPDLIPRSDSECWEFGVQEKTRENHQTLLGRETFQTPGEKQLELTNYTDLSIQDQEGSFLLERESQDTRRDRDMSGTLRNREYSMRNHGLKSAEEERGLNKSFYQDKSHYLGIQPGPVQVLGHRDLLTTKSRTLAFLKEKRESIV
ncbi:Down syndrome cell adhesion molecule-like protein 1 homolog [Eurytemora carolleeae]|uniref:Down syndrome cell adhesion molecule-like protein 1 homolog n=1 Tax=Eurytemora carolleeae TaxID=1294199 RepID=UPI000C76C21A|nr:Down syndrome cell adhesion molecule-like protein 1 homolog [Eurytemora carolleeae]|eukprot:XP_023321524.1 Down syndrome cell adhesion molecule-like protein 1 homolog [Eurytemora affinis]